MELCLSALAATDIPTVDITGGAPELHPHFRWFVAEIRKLGRHVIDRCNLTILETPSHRDLPGFFAEHAVEVVCSLPHHAKLSTDRQRGDGVHERSIRALRRLNEVGYGQGRAEARLVIVTNPVGAFLPGPQASLEREWRRELLDKHGLVFDALYTINGTLAPFKYSRTSFREVTVQGTLYMTDRALLNDYAAGTQRRLLITAMNTVAAIQSGYYNMITIDVPQMKLTSFPLAIGGPGEVAISFTGRGVIDPSSNYSLRITTVTTWIAGF
jgi:radical SAM/Cys-rich protein